MDREEHARQPAADRHLWDGRGPFPDIVPRRRQCHRPGHPEAESLCRDAFLLTELLLRSVDGGVACTGMRHRGSGMETFSPTIGMMFIPALAPVAAPADPA